MASEPGSKVDDGDSTSHLVTNTSVSTCGVDFTLRGTMLEALLTTQVGAGREAVSLVHGAQGGIIQRAPRGGVVQQRIQE